MAERHPVADLLTDEQRERVRATEFVNDCNGVSAQPTERSDRRCPLAVAVGLDCSIRPWVYRALGVPQPHPAVENFMEWADRQNDPADVKVLLGCEP
jgi:hypothetical protein